MMSRTRALIARDESSMKEKRRYHSGATSHFCNSKEALRRLRVGSSESRSIHLHVYSLIVLATFFFPRDLMESLVWLCSRTLSVLPNRGSV